MPLPTNPITTSIHSIAKLELRKDPKLPNLSMLTSHIRNQYLIGINPQQPGEIHHVNIASQNKRDLKQFKQTH